MGFAKPAPSPYPPVERWSLPAHAVEVTLAAVRAAGLRGVESGVFWLGERDQESKITAVVHPAGEGVHELAYEWRVEPEVFGAISTWAKERDVTLLGIAHIHLSEAPPQLSWSDRRRFVRVPNFLSVIIPAGGAEYDLKKWGWFEFDTDDFREIRRPECRYRIVIDPTQRVEFYQANKRGLMEVEGSLNGFQ